MSSAPDPLYLELDRQKDVLRREMPERVVLTALAFDLCLPFAPPSVLAAIWLVHLLAEGIGLVVLRPAFILRSRLHYAVSLAQSIVVEASYMMAPGLVWQSQGEMAKAFAVGMAAMTLMHLATVRAIHLPCGIAGLAGVAISAIIFNTFYWVQQGNYVGLAISAATIFGGLGYTLTAMLSINRLHRSMAAEETSAWRAHEVKSLFLAQISHELRTPLNAVIGMGQAELGEATQSDPEGQTARRLGVLVDNARMLSVILDDVTDLNASDQGRLRLRDRNILLRDEIRAAFAGFTDRASRLGVAISLEETGPDPGEVRMDLVRLRQCITNLLNNALRHAPGGPIRAVCRFEPDQDQSGGGRVHLTISDSGPGVPLAKREAIFEAFHQGRTGAPGTGLGLAIVRTLARQMGGDLVLLPSRSGATFGLGLAFDAALAPGQPHRALPDLRSCRVLVVDDIATNRLVAATYLRSGGAQVVEAPSGSAALALLSSDEIDLVLLDMNMPGMDGFEVIRRLRGMGGRLAGIPVIAMTADVMPEHLVAFRQAGIDGHVGKPLLPEALTAEIQRLLA